MRTEKIITDLKEKKIDIGFAGKKVVDRDIKSLSLFSEDIVLALNKKNKLSLLKFPKVGAGILTSATWSTGIGILNENIVKIKPGDKIDYLSYNEIIN